MANPFFSARIPKDLDERIKQRIAETGESKTDILINALAAYLNYPISRVASTTTISGDEERLRLLEERVEALELSLREINNKNFVINADNGNLDKSTDNNPDNNSGNELLVVDEEDPWKESINNEVDISDNSTDNNIDNAFQYQEESIKLLPEHKPAKLEKLTSRELFERTGLRQSQLDNYKRRVAAKYQNMGQPLEKRKLLEVPERIETKNPTIVNGYPYDLFYVGENEKGKSLWATLPYDNKRYQQLSLNNSKLLSN